MLSKILPRVPPKNPIYLATKNEIRQLQLKPFKRIHFKFDPFHSKNASIRGFLFLLDRKQVTRTNPKCIIKTDIVGGQAEPTISAQLENGKQILFKTSNLTTFELLQYFNQFTKKFSQQS